MTITQVKVFPVQEEKLKAYVSIVFDACFRAIQRGITRPARETLFTVVSREDKYKSKAVTDTFVYRGGDLLGAWTEGWLGQLGLGLVTIVTSECLGSACFRIVMIVAEQVLDAAMRSRQQPKHDTACRDNAEADVNFWLP